MNLIQKTAVRFKALTAKKEYLQQIADTRRMLAGMMCECEEILQNGITLSNGAVEHANRLAQVKSDFPLFLPYNSYLYFLVRITKPERVIETGVERGASTYCILQAMRENGRGMLISIDRTPTRFGFYGLEKAPVVPRELANSGHWQHIEGYSTDHLAPVILGKDIDIFIAGSAHTYENQRFEVMTAWPYIRNDGYLVIDRPDYDGNRFRVWDEVLKTYNPRWSRVMPESHVSLPYRFGIIAK